MLLQNIDKLNPLRATAAPRWKEKEGGEPEVCYAFFYSSLTVWEKSVWKREMRWPPGNGLGGACGCFGVPLREHWKGFGAIPMPLGRLWGAREGLREDSGGPLGGLEEL